MLVDLSKPLLNLKGEPFREGEADVQLSAPCVEALLGNYPEEVTLSAADKVKRFRLAQHLLDASAVARPFVLSVEDAAYIRRLVAMMYGPLIVGRVFEALGDLPDDAPAG
jgi:hypothetical protein